MVSILSDEGYIFGIKATSIRDVNFAPYSNIYEGRNSFFWQGNLLLVTKAREPSIVSTSFYNAAINFANGQKASEDVLKQCEAKIPKDVKASVNSFDYRPTLSSTMHDNSISLEIDTTEAFSGWAGDRGVLKMTFSNSAVHKDLHGTEEKFSYRQLYPLILAMHIAQHSVDDEDEAFRNDRKENKYSAQPEPFAWVPNVAAQLGF